MEKEKEKASVRRKASETDMGGGAVEFRLGAAVGTAAPATDEDIARVSADLRPLDRFEQDFFAERTGAPRDSLDQMERAWTLRIGGEAVGYVGLQLPPFASPLSSVRFVPMLSTTAAGRHWIDYVRLSRPVLDWTLRQAPPWVTEFWSFPLARYDASVRWHEKTMRWRRAGEVDVLGERAVAFRITRKGA